ncbi:hypothetical protein ACFQH6_14820 [Halobacteriaceae archaeon GCM10025711]
MNTLRESLDERLDYPIDLAGVREEIGDELLEAPDAEDSTTVGDVLAIYEEDTYESADELHQAILSNLPDEYVGRKHYSDRGTTAENSGTDEPTDEEDQSF